MRHIDRISKDLEAAKLMAESNVNDGDPRTLSFRIGSKNRAKEDLQNLFIEYRDYYKDKAVFIIVSGQGHAKFAEIADSTFNCFSTPAEALMERIVNDIPKEVYENKVTNNGMFDSLSARLENEMTDLNIKGYNALMFEHKMHRKIENRQDFVNFVKDVIVDKVGGEVVAIDALSNASRKGSLNGFKSHVMPVIINTKDENFAIKLSQEIKSHFTKKVFLVGSGISGKEFNLQAFTRTQKVEDSSVEEVLKKIREVV